MKLKSQAVKKENIGNTSETSGKHTTSRNFQMSRKIDMFHHFRCCSCSLKAGVNLSTAAEGYIVSSRDWQKLRKADRTGKSRALGQWLAGTAPGIREAQGGQGGSQGGAREAKEEPRRPGGPLEEPGRPRRTFKGGVRL